RLRPVIEATLETGRGYRNAFAECAKAGPTVARFFDDVLVMAEDPAVREARLRLLKGLERLILQLADVSEIVPEEK
ncbi:MAG: glycine--tRNA ligase subunit beta, partial [Vicinamibacterales bacterium]